MTLQLTKTQEPNSDQLHEEFGITEHDETKTTSGHNQMLETYGKDLAAVQAMNLIYPNRVWTIVDGDDGILRVIPGYQTINRINYLFTKKPWTDPTQTYVWEH